MELRGLWQAVLGELEVSVSRANFATWLKNTSVVANENGRIVVAVPHFYAKKWLEEKYHSDILKAVTKVTGTNSQVEFRISSLAPVVATPELAMASPSAIPAAAAKPNLTKLNPRYTFDNFVVGSSNELAYAAAGAVAKNPGTKYNPLFIYGGAGLGKTHLMQAIGNEILKRDPAKTVEYVTSEGFTNEFIASISRKKNSAFTDKYRNVDVLIVDDVQFLMGKEKTVDEFFHTFNALHHTNKQIILSSDKPPQALTGLEDRLRSRFGWGMTADIAIPDLETRAAILQSKAAAQGINLPLEVVDYLARNIRQNIRELEGALTQLIAHCELRACEPALSDAMGLVAGISAGKSRLKPLSAKLIIEQTASFFDLASADITGTKRDKAIVTPRQLAMYLMRHELGLSYPKIASSVGGRDHTTAMHSVTKIENQLEADENLRQQLNLIKERLTI